MFKKSHRGMAIILTVALLVGMMPTMAFAENEPNNENAYKYVSIGASNVNGYGLRGYVNPGEQYNNDTIMEAAALDPSIKQNANVLGYLRAPEDSYPAKLRAALASKLGKNVELNQLAISSMRVEEVRLLLDDTYEGDAYSRWRFIGDEDNWFVIAKDGGRNELGEEYRKYISAADLVTLDIGVNNFGVYLMQMIMDGFTKHDKDLSVIDPQIGKAYTALKDPIKNLLKAFKADLDVSTYEGLLDTLAYALVGFCYNFDKVVEKIYELNPGVNLAVVSIQNLMDGVKIDLGGTTLPLGDILGSVINMANIYMASGSKYCDEYVCVDVRKSGHVTFFGDEIVNYVDGTPGLLDKNIIDCFNVYDGTPDSTYEEKVHLKHRLYTLLKAAFENTETTTQNESQEEDISVSAEPEIVTMPAITEESFESAVNGKLIEGQTIKIEDEPVTIGNDITVQNILNILYDGFAQIVRDGCKLDTISMDMLSADTGNAETVLENMLDEEIINAIKAGISGKPYKFNLEAKLKEVSESTEVSVGLLKSIVLVYMRSDIGNSFFAHPSPAGHEEIKTAIMSALDNETKGKAIIKDEVNKATKKVYKATQTAVAKVTEGIFKSISNAVTNITKKITQGITDTFKNIFSGSWLKKIFAH